MEILENAVRESLPVIREAFEVSILGVLDVIGSSIRFIDSFCRAFLIIDDIK